MGLRTTEPTAALNVLTSWRWVVAELDALTATRPSLEDVYLELTGAGEQEPAHA